MNLKKGDLVLDIGSSDGKGEIGIVISVDNVDKWINILWKYNLKTRGQPYECENTFKFAKGKFKKINEEEAMVLII